MVDRNRLTKAESTENEIKVKKKRERDLEEAKKASSTKRFEFLSSALRFTYLAREGNRLATSLTRGFVEQDRAILGGR